MTTKTITTNPKILLLDIETSHNIIAAFDIYNPSPFQNILQERYIFCAAWKWLGKAGIETVSVLDNKAKAPYKDDSYVVKKLHGVMSEADAVIAHYGNKFDLPMINSRIIKYRLSPLPPFIKIDTKNLASRGFRFNCNRLDYLGQYLGLGRKIKTDPGLWIKCLNGDKKALMKMIRYNKGDITLLERIYKILKPYVPAQVNKKLFEPTALCSSCGGHSIQYRGYAYTNTRKYRRYQCNSCGSWGKDDRSTPV